MFCFNIERLFLYGSKYEGDFKNDKFEDDGTMTLHNRNKILTLQKCVK